MGTIILTFASVGAICAVGVGISTGLKWFHEFEIEMPVRTKEEKGKGKEKGGGANASHPERIKRELRQRS